jgi:hypothetical protein
MSIKGRINLIAEFLMPRGLWGGATVEDLGRYGFFSGEPDEHAPPGVWRVAAYASIRGIWLDLHDPERDAGSREEHGLTGATDEEVRARLLEIAVEHDFTRAEMRKLRQELEKTGKPRTW